MAFKISNPDFFRNKLNDTTNDNGQAEGHIKEPAAGSDCGHGMVRAEPLRLGIEVNELVEASCRVLKETGFPALAAEVDTVRKRAMRERFAIAVVGEFSKGKSTFINRLLDRDILPTGNLPTTAVMTRIRFNQREVIAAFDENNKKSFERPLSPDSWDNLVAQNFGGNDFKGTVLVGVKSDWLDAGNIELIDTPGAGDLNEERMKAIGDALLGCDGAIIAISATAPLSLSEKLFIEERLLARKLPFLLLIITKLDMVQYEERAGVIRYIKDKLKSWKMDVPVYVPYRVELSETGFDDMIGMDKVQKEIAGWIGCPERARLTEAWVLGKTLDALKNTASALTVQMKLLEEADGKKRAQLITEKRNQLAQAELLWGDLKLQMQQRCTSCYQALLKKVDEYSESITERLQYEASHAMNPQKWWKEDFPYRTKVELTNMAVGVENFVSRIISEDVRWYSTAIETSFKSHVLFRKATISDKELFGDFAVGGKLEFENLDKQRTFVKIGSAVLSISGFALFSAMGFLPIVATMGIGTGTAIISEKFFRNKIEEQKEELKKEIARCVPLFIQDAMAESESRLSAVYNNIISEAEKSEQAWLSAQLAAIEVVKVNDSKDQYKELCSRLTRLEQDYVVIPVGADEKQIKLQSPYEKVELFFPLELLKNGVEIIDSPGLNEDETRTRVTMDYLPKVDAVLYVLNANAICAGDEMKFVQNDLRGNNIDSVFFIVNRFDQIRSREQPQIRQYAELKLKEFYPKPELFCISALHALDGRLDHNEALVEQSGMIPLERRLTEFLTKEKGRAKLASPAKQVRQILSRETLEVVIPRERKLLESSLDDVKQRYESIKPRLKAATAKKEQQQAEMATKIERSCRKFERLAKRSMADIINSVPVWIEEFTPATSLGAIPSKAKTEQVIKDLSEYLKDKLSETQADWQKNVLLPEIEEEANAIFSGAEKDLSKIFKEIDDINVELTGEHYSANRFLYGSV